MYVYIQSEKTWNSALWTVGFYDPSGKWHPESDHDKESDAAERAHWINGGKLLEPREVGSATQR